MICIHDITELGYTYNKAKSKLDLLLRAGAKCITKTCSKSPHLAPIRHASLYDSIEILKKQLIIAKSETCRNKGNIGEKKIFLKKLQKLRKERLNENSN